MWQLTVGECDELEAASTARACHNKEVTLLLHKVRRSRCLHVELPNMEAFKLVLTFAAQPIQAATPCRYILGMVPLPQQPD